jgi:hypothetical protein
MAVSPFANAHFGGDQSSGVLILPGNGNTKEAVTCIADYLIKVCNSANVFRLPWKDVKKTAAIYQVGRTLEMGTFFHHISTYLVTQIQDSNGIMDYADLNTVLNRTNNDVTDPVFKRYAHALSALRYKGEIPDSLEFATWLSRHPELAQMMDDIDAEQETKRNKFQAAKDASLAHKGRANRRPRAQAARKRAGNQQSADENKLPEMASTFGPGIHHIGAEAARKLGKMGFSA